ncbi:class I SAM-dependent methyltransferase [Paenibacillus polymyxa]|uniref:SAM-dependent methyltransferase n=1 Tax=Paenibacillus polymyxa TaxID=1406 RepID=A0A378XWP9_PAEPO|nr:class I SAM-dependent methyltransferase [Paenibacillus polymyxa]MBE7896981.1 class I SAM-dependent methyltransferase [Paenibacillus polymyxa]MBG9762846.1 SAM-dependent methyltransferase [Paenibacillus polymyxa]MCC3257771.1 class I SAM-dependent methyltransferase [Paenibacillus polymyxa]QPK55898.1 class I SAM-dependent methyltransferase [Paenibacillus polymyxa]QPK60985.1 class I SAM-dependent methyltransferase [Paenibacillus polymyxa]
MDNWKDIWSRTRHLPNEDPDLQFLIDTDGFNSGAGKISEEAWSTYVRHAASLMNIQPDESLFEVGCGSGAFLYPFYKNGHQVSGIDYSPSLIEIASFVMPEMDFSILEATQVDPTRRFDIVLANSVFQYFPSLEYAEEVLRLMWEKTNRLLVLLDLNDIQFAEEALRIRKGSLSLGEYEKKYAGLEHLFYDRNFAEKALKGKRFTINISNQQIKSYGNNKFRYNVVIEKW